MAVIDQNSDSLWTQTSGTVIPLATEILVETDESTFKWMKGYFVLTLPNGKRRSYEIQIVQSDGQLSHSITHKIGDIIKVNSIVRINSGNVEIGIESRETTNNIEIDFIYLQITG